MNRALTGLFRTDQSGRNGPRGSSLRRLAGRFLADQRGSATIEFVLWIPVFAALLMLTADASITYLTATRMENAARDAARRVSIGQYDTASIVDYVSAELNNQDYVVTATCTTEDYACVNISRPVDTVITFGILSALLGQSINAQSKMRYEPTVEH